jgi:hypothetical protein
MTTRETQARHARLAAYVALVGAGHSLRLRIAYAPRGDEMFNEAQAAFLADLRETLRELEGRQ